MAVWTMATPIEAARPTASASLASAARGAPRAWTLGPRRGAS